MEQQESYSPGELQDKQAVPAARAVKALSEDLTGLRLRRPVRADQKLGHVKAQDVYALVNLTPFLYVAAPGSKAMHFR